MKAMKNKTANEEGKDLNSKIHNYFKVAPKEFNEVKVCTPSDSKSVYIRALKDRLKSFDGQNESSANDINQDGNDDPASVTVDHNNAFSSCDGCCKWRRKYESLKASDDMEWRKKYEVLKESHIKLSLRFGELVLKNDELIKTATNAVTVSNDEASDILSSTDDIFTVSEIKVLEHFPLEKKKDSTFILQCVQYAYKENSSTLLNKTLKGTRERTDIKDDGTVEIHPAKDPLTPEKVKRIEELFIKRVTESKCLAGEFTERIKTTNINRLIASAIKNVSNKAKPNVLLSKQNVDLNL